MAPKPAPSAPSKAPAKPAAPAAKVVAPAKAGAKPTATAAKASAKPSAAAVKSPAPAGKTAPPKTPAPYKTSAPSISTVKDVEAESIDIGGGGGGDDLASVLAMLKGGSDPPSSPSKASENRPTVIPTEFKDFSKIAESPDTIAYLESLKKKIILLEKQINEPRRKSVAIKPSSTVESSEQRITELEVEILELMVDYIRNQLYFF